MKEQRASLYALNFAACVHDEIHAARRPSSTAYHALRCLSHNSSMCIGMTATPIITGIDDAWNECRIIRHPRFDGQTNSRDFVAIRTRMNAARASARRKHGDVARIPLARALEDLNEGNNAGGPIATDEASKAIYDISRDVSERLNGCGIRRTIRSTDYANNPIIELAPAVERNLLVSLYDSEQAAIDVLMREYLEPEGKKEGGKREVRETVTSRVLG